MAANNGQLMMWSRVRRHRGPVGASADVHFSGDRGGSVSDLPRAEWSASSARRDETLSRLWREPSGFRALLQAVWETIVKRENMKHENMKKCAVHVFMFHVSRGVGSWQNLIGQN